MQRPKFNHRAVNTQEYYSHHIYELNRYITHLELKVCDMSQALKFEQIKEHSNEPFGTIIK